MWLLDFKRHVLAEICPTLLYSPIFVEEIKTKSLQTSRSLTFDLFCGAPSLNLQRNWRKRTHPELIDFPQTAAPAPRFMDDPGTSAASVCQWNLYFFLFLFFFFFFLMDMVLAVHQSLSSGVSSCGAKSCSKASCFSFGHSVSICYYDEFFLFLFFSCSLVQKAPVCLICKECFQLPLVAMTDGKTIKSKRAPPVCIFLF